MVFVPFLVLVLFACQLHHEIMFFLYHVMCIGWDELEQSFDVSGSNSWEQEFHYHGHVFPPCVCVAVSGALIKVSEQKWNETNNFTLEFCVFQNFNDDQGLRASGIFIPAVKI
jgi:hypothetical protein